MEAVDLAAQLRWQRGLRQPSYMPKLFTRSGEWAGGGYELAMQYRSESRFARRALAALWSLPKVGPCYARNDVEPHAQVALDLDSARLEALTRVYGTCTFGGVEGKRRVGIWPSATASLTRHAGKAGSQPSSFLHRGN